MKFKWIRNNGTRKTGEPTTKPIGRDDYWDFNGLQSWYIYKILEEEEAKNKKYDDKLSNHEL